MIQKEDVRVTKLPAFMRGISIDVPWDNGTVRLHVREVEYSKSPVVTVGHVERKVPVAAPEPETILVGVVFNQHYGTPYEAAQSFKAGMEKVFTYKALAALKLTVGDVVECPIGTLNHPTAWDSKTGTVVTLDPKPTQFFMRTITNRA